MGVGAAPRLSAAEHLQHLKAPTAAQPRRGAVATAPRTYAGPASQRLHSLDVLRGITIAAMLLVNNPGTAKFGYRVLQHADWNGCQPPDFIFPFFLFIAGVSITYSLARPQGRGVARRALLIKIGRRTLIIFGLGMLLNLLPYFDWEVTRIPGVLQRIALCYCAASLLVLYTGIRVQGAAAVLLLVVYGALMKWVPVPGVGAASLEPDTNLVAYIDRALMGGHLWHRHWDPEGLLSTVPAVSTTLIGVLAGYWLRGARRSLERVGGLLIAGCAGMALGVVMDHWLPINKTLWSSSYVLFTGGAALVGLAFCHWLVDLRGYRRWATPFVVFGTNAIFAYALSSLLTKLLALWTVTRSDGMRVMLKTHLFELYFLPLAARRQASILYALAFVLLWLGVTGILYRKRVFIKV
ncbi:MAG TPA: heparan-alpha-glucosaminide N-acetyltransferase domain-containing protein [Candidatus Margulisiibacteriota bacterium]|nr:heparan-alpha-glucosaminide N-acetyltransferase domain-containing protein [Candidatus Margulisiibacteriota bacterium]